MTAGYRLYFMGITEYDRQQVQRLLTQEGQVKYLFDKFVRQAGMYLSQYKAGATVRDERDVWIRNTAIEKKIERLLDDLHGDLMRNIENNASVSWKAANAKTDNIIKAYIKDLALSETATQGMFARNAEALDAFLKRRVGAVSERVWKTAESAKADLEYYLSSGLATGRPAGLISQDIRQLLQNPERRFRRVRDENGRLVMSKPMMNYHPGQGVYRSAYKNALRVAATETNMAYHEADAERWSRLDFVTGVKVSRSNSNRGPCAVCDALVGTYPKGFKFLPWHPFCICFAVPVMLEGDAFVDYLVKGESDEGKGESGKYIKEMPAGALEFFGKNAAMRASTAYLENRRWFAEEGTGKAVVSIKPKSPVAMIEPADNRMPEETVKGLLFAHERWKHSYDEMLQNGISVEGLSDVNAASVYDYSKIGYKGLNTDLYLGKELSEFKKAFVQSLNDAIDVLPKVPENTGLFRGAYIPNEIVRKYEVGAVVTEQAFISTSAVYEQAEKFIEVIKKPGHQTVMYLIKGTSAASMDGISHWAQVKKKSEREFLFRNGTRFVVSDVYKRNGILYIEMEEK